MNMDPITLAIIGGMAASTLANIVGSEKQYRFAKRQAEAAEKYREESKAEARRAALRQQLGGAGRTRPVEVEQITPPNMNFPNLIGGLGQVGATLGTMAIANASVPGATSPMQKAYNTMPPLGSTRGASFM